MHDDELIMRFADGELDAADRARAEARLAADPALQAAVERQRTLRQNLAAAFDPVLEEPVPERLLDTVQRPKAEVIPLQRRRHPRVGGFGPVQWGAMAATLAIGIYAGQLLDKDTEALIGRSGERLVAGGEFAGALTARSVSDGDPASLRIGLSFRARDGVYCRTFEGVERMAGVACREGEVWAIRMAVRDENADADTGYRMAASGVYPPVLAYVEAVIQGDPLDAIQEARAQAGGWTSDAQ